MGTTDIVALPSGLLQPVAAVEELLEHSKRVGEIVRRTLEPGRDYGQIPGVERQTLLKPGAERLAVAFGLTPVIRIIEKEIEHNAPVQWSRRTWVAADKPGSKSDVEAAKAAGVGRFRKSANGWVWQEAVEESGVAYGIYRYVIEVQLVTRSGQIVGSGLGSCSSLEMKYVRSPRDAENTVLKMAEKRALVSAVLKTFALSDRFSQDVEDLPGEITGVEESVPAPEPPPEAPVREPEDLSTREGRERFCREAISASGAILARWGIRGKAAKAFAAELKEAGQGPEFLIEAFVAGADSADEVRARLVRPGEEPDVFADEPDVWDECMYAIRERDWPLTGPVLLKAISEITGVTVHDPSELDDATIRQLLAWFDSQAGDPDAIAAWRRGRDAQYGGS